MTHTYLCLFSTPHATDVGASQLKNLTKRTTFIRVSQQLNPMFNALPDLSTSKKDTYSAGSAAAAAAAAAAR